MADALLVRWLRLQPGGVPAVGRSHGGLLLLGGDASVAVGGAGVDDGHAQAAPLDVASTRLALHALTTAPVDRAGLEPASASASSASGGRSVRAGLCAHTVEVTQASGGVTAVQVLLGSACAAGNQWLPAAREASVSAHVLSRDGRRWLACDLNARVRAMGELPADARLAVAPVARVGAASAALNNRVVVFGGVTSRRHARLHPACAAAAAADASGGGGDDTPVFLNDVFYLSFSTEVDEGEGAATSAGRSADHALAAHPQFSRPRCACSSCRRMRRRRPRRRRSRPRRPQPFPSRRRALRATRPRRRCRRRPRRPARAAARRRARAPLRKRR
jgi:hypothetical protein